MRSFLPLLAFVVGAAITWWGLSHQAPSWAKSGPLYPFSLPEVIVGIAIMVVLPFLLRDHARA